MFDDSFEHEVWCDAKGKVPRVILIVDVWHANVTARMKQVAAEAMRTRGY